MKKQSRDEMLETVYYRQHQQSEQLKHLLSVFIQDTVQKCESRYYTRLEVMVVRYVEQKIRRSISLLVKDNLKSPPLAVVQPRASLSVK